MTQAFFWQLDRIPPDQPALVIAATGQVIRYGELCAMRDAVRAQMSAGRGLCRIEARPTPQVIATYLAALTEGCPVILEEPQKSGTRPAGSLPVLYTLSESTVELHTDMTGAGVDLHPDLAMLLSTSGSTGAQKFVRLSHQNLNANAASIAEYLALTDQDRAPTALPLAYSYGMSVLNSHLHAGASLLLTDTPVISEEFWTAFETHRCTSFAGVPQSFTLLLRGGQLDRTYPVLRYVTQAGGKLGPDAVQSLARMGKRHGWAFFVMYGQTEAAPRIAYLPPDLAEKYPGAIGRAIPGGSLRIAGPDGTECPPGIEGELVYEGPNVMMGYATSVSDLAKGLGPSTLHTGDLGQVDPESGLIRITGRASRFVKLSGKRVSLDEIDTWLAQEGVTGIAVGEDDDLGLVHTDARVLAPGIAARLSVPSGFVRDVRVAELPLNQNGKPDLPAAKALFAEQRAQQTVDAPTPSTVDTDTVLALFQRQFPGVRITPETCFDDLGGTSNEFVELELALEAIGIPPEQNWQNHRIADLASKAGATLANAPVPVPDYASARVICTLLVILVHVIGLRGGGGLDLPADSIWPALNDFFDALRMPFFAMMAGFSFHIMQTARNRPGELLSTLAIRIALPTAAAMAAFMALSTVLGTRFAAGSILDVLQLLWLPYAHFWFIMGLIVMMLIGYGLLRYGGRLAEWALITLGIGLCFYDRFFIPNILAVNAFTALMPFFVAGYFYARHAPILHARWIPITAVALLAVVAISLIYRSFAPVELGPLVKPSNILLSLSMICLCLLISRMVPFLAVLAPYTFFIYLWHVIGTSGMRRALEMVGIEHLAAMIPLGILAGIALPVALYHLLGHLPGGRLLRGK